MADVIIIPGNVGVSEILQPLSVQVTEPVTQGQLGYRNNSQYSLANAVTSAETAAATGMFLSAAPANGYAVYVEAGLVFIGTGLLIAGKPYVLSGAASGGLAPVEDLVNPWHTTVIGIAADNDSLQITINASGVIFGS